MDKQADKKTKRQSSLNMQKIIIGVAVSYTHLPISVVLLFRCRLRHGDNYTETHFLLLMSRKWVLKDNGE